MISRLKSLELQGYKTFANRTIFEFPGAVTAIVGPNGSGKSNITDALRWVLGEQSYTLLRGKKTEDMIFSGSEMRTRSGMAAVTVILDNSDNWLPIDYSEVAIARRAYRDGSNEYLLNGQRVRLKDVSELLSKSGLAERTYTIIGQGLVDAALALRAEDRRRLFEEAAGIGLHRRRRAEAVRRLEITNRNLERIEDILTELRPRVRSLERQARRAIDYEQAVNELRLLLKQWYGYHWHQAQEELSQVQMQVKELKDELDESGRRNDVLENDVSLLRAKRKELREKLSSLNQQSLELNSNKERINRELIIFGERANYLQEQESNYRKDITKIEQEIGLLHDQIRSGSEEIDKLTLELEEAKDNAGVLKEKYENKYQERKEIEVKIDTARQLFIEVIARRSELNARKFERLNQLSLLEGSKTTAEKAIKEGIKDLKKSESEIDDRLSAVREGEKRCINTENEIEVILQEIFDQRKNQQIMIKKFTELETEFAKSVAHLEVIEQAQDSRASFSEGARILVEAAQERRLDGSKGLLVEKIRVPEKFEVAIGAALGEYLEALILDDKSSIDNALSILEKTPEKAALIPLGDIVSPIETINFPHEENIFGIAKDLVTASDEFLPVINLLLGSIVVVQDRRTARKLLKKIRKQSGLDKIPDWRIVTINGEVFFARGPVSRSSKRSHGSFSQKREFNKIQRHVKNLESELADLDSQLSQIKTRLDSLEDEERVIKIRYQKEQKHLDNAKTAHSKQVAANERIKQELKWREDKKDQVFIELQRGQEDIEKIQRELKEIQEEERNHEQKHTELNEQLNLLFLDDLQTDLVHWTTRIAVIEQSLNEMQARQNERKQWLDEETKKLSSIAETLAEMEKTRPELAAKIADLQESEMVVNREGELIRASIASTENDFEANEDQLMKLLAHETEERSVANKIDQNYAQIRITLVRKQEALETIRRQIDADFGLVEYEYLEDVSGPTPLPLEGIVENLPLVKDLPVETEEALKRQRALLRRIGPINPEAMKEYIEVQERYDFLSNQVTDLHNAANDVHQVISELDEIMDREFCTTYEAVAEEFHQIFNRLFGGGSARLVLTDPDDLTDSGIDIEARLPGRREQGLSLLSGGERSLTAVALVFALLRVSPTPFCVLDEVDAMLDEANVGRFRELLRELSLQTQFILITHNRATVQVADIIYGVTMGRDSTSQILSLKVDELEEVV